MNKQGFTLLEVTLFFAVSGLLALVAFAGLGPRLRNVRFTDAVRALESTTQKQLSDFKSGANLRPENIGCSLSGGSLQILNTETNQTAGSSADCIINGRLAVLGEDRAVYYPVVSLRNKINTCAADATHGTLFCHSPTILGFSNSITEVSHRNGARITSPSIGLLYLQDPNGTETKLMGFNALQVPVDTVHPIDPDVDLRSLPQVACMGLGGRTAQLQYNSGSLQPQITFEGC